MITEEGIITKTTDSTAWIETVRSKACDSCHSKDSCDAQRDTMFVQVDKTLDVDPGDRVVIGFRTSPLLKLSFMLYVFPIILLITGASLGQYAAAFIHTDPSLTSLGAGIGAFALSFLIVRVTGNRLSVKSEYKPFMLRKATNTATAPPCNLPSQ